MATTVNIPPTKSYSCDWRLTKHKIIQRGKQIRETGQWTDCKFIVGQEPHQKTVKAHKLILTMSSPVFEAMFFGEMAEKNDTIPVTDIQPEAFEALLEYIYTDHTKLGSLELVSELCYCANKYMLPFLEEECTNFILSDLSPGKVCRVYEITKLLGKPVAMEKCLQVVRTETDRILKDPSFLEIKSETLITILEQEELRINSEIELFSAAEKWAKAECVRKDLNPGKSESMRSVLGNALTKIRFLTLTSQEFSESVADSPLFEENETLAILRNISSGNLKCAMPEIFSTNMQRRISPPHTNKDSSMILYMPSTNETSGTYSLDNIPIRAQNQQDAKSGKDYPKIILAEDDEIEKSLHLEYYCCNRFALKKRTIDVPTTESEYEIFKVNSNIMLLGIQVPSQIGNDVSSYEEDLTLIVENESFGMVATKKFTAVVNTGSFIKVTFETPVMIERNKKYYVKIEFGKTGCYPRLPYTERMICNGKFFTFGDPTYESDALISSIFWAPLL